MLTKKELDELNVGDPIFCGLFNKFIENGTARLTVERKEYGVIVFSPINDKDKREPWKRTISDHDLFIHEVDALYKLIGEGKKYIEKFESRIKEILYDLEVDLELAQTKLKGGNHG